MEESVTCQFTIEQSMAEKSEKTTAGRLFFYWSGYVSRVDLNSNEYFLTCYCEPFIGFAVELKELCDHTESVFCSRLES